MSHRMWFLIVREICFVFLSRCGDDLLSHVLRRSTISAVALNGRVRDGIGCFAHAMITTPRKKHRRKRQAFPPGGKARLRSKCAATGQITWVSPSLSAVDRVFLIDRVAARLQANMLCHPVDRRGAIDRVQVSTTDVVVCIHADRCSGSLASTGSDQAYRTISTGQLNALLRLHLRPIDEVVYLGPQGYLVLRGASRLDAFSGYPVRS